jgi:dihydroxyacetone kinase-like predicted kinase
VIVLPNSSNVILAAQHAAQLSEKTVMVVETRSPQAGIVCLVEYDPEHHVEENAQLLSEALEGIHTGWVAPAARDDKKGRYRKGEAVGSVKGETMAWGGDAEPEIMAWGDPRSTIVAVLERLAPGCELMTCFAGEGAPLDEDAVRSLAPDGVELDYQQGDQPHYWWLIAAE